MNQALWRDCFKWLPYRDYEGRWVLCPLQTQCRTRNGVIEYREREETAAEWAERS